MTQPDCERSVAPLREKNAFIFTRLLRLTRNDMSFIAKLGTVPNYSFYQLFFLTSVILVVDQAGSLE